MNSPPHDDDDELDCPICDDDDFNPEPTADADIDGIVLFADLAGTTDLEAIATRKAEWETLFG